MSDPSSDSSTGEDRHAILAPGSAADVPPRSATAGPMPWPSATGPGGSLTRDRRVGRGRSRARRSGAGGEPGLSGCPAPLRRRGSLCPADGPVDAAPFLRGLDRPARRPERGARGGRRRPLPRADRGPGGHVPGPARFERPDRRRPRADRLGGRCPGPGPARVRHRAAATTSRWPRPAGGRPASRPWPGSSPRPTPSGSSIRWRWTPTPTSL